MQPPKQVFEVSFLVTYADGDSEPDFHHGGDADEFAEDSTETVTTMVLCSEELSLAEFTQRCEASKLNLVEQLGYVDLEAADITLVSVENVSEVHIAVLQPITPLQH